MADYYEVLGIKRGATPSEVKTAFRRLARQWHPDVSEDKEGAEARFLKMLEAYEVLGDAEKREQYDRSLLTGAPAGLSHFDLEDFSRVDELEDLMAGELLETLFGRRGRFGPRKGPDLRFDVELSLEEAFGGAEKEVPAPRTENCPECSAGGPAGRRATRSCTTCSGLGQVKSVRARGAARFVAIEPCTSCAGTGRVPEDRCPSCGGRGTVVRPRPVKVRIPAGVEDGAVLRMPDEGSEGRRGGPRGDLYLVIKVRPHHDFRRDGPDLHCTREVSFSMAAVGGLLEVRAPAGKAALKVPPGTQTGTVLRLAGLGMPRSDGEGRGDLLVTIMVSTPAKLTRRQKEILQELERPRGAGRRGWWRRWT